MLITFTMAGMPLWLRIERNFDGSTGCVSWSDFKRAAVQREARLIEARDERMSSAVPQRSDALRPALAVMAIRGRNHLIRAVRRFYMAVARRRRGRSRRGIGWN